jgi:3-oxoacyl-[acyl-carrier protein] reductase
MMNRPFENKVAVVTGSSKGIGAEIARDFARKGASVVVNYSRSKTEADNLVNEIVKKGGKAIAIQADVSQEADIKRLFSETKKTYGPIDILVNNAGIYEFSPLEEVTADHFHKQFNLNVLGLILASQEAVRHFNSKGGSIINVSSAIVSLLPPDSVVYSATKAAVDAITKVLSKELAPQNIRVNAVNPGMIETEGVVSAGLNEGDMREWVESTTPLKRIGQVRDVAPVVSFLVSDDAGYMTGETLFIAGGVN